MKTLFKLKYPKIFLLILFIILAYVIFSNPKVSGFISSLDNLKYLGIFIAGIFFTFGFSSPFSAGFFITSNPDNILLAGVIAGFGAMLGDLFIFNLIRFSFIDEFQKLKKTKIAREINSVIEKDFGKKIKNYLMYTFVGILIASPLPDEIGVIMLAGLTKIKQNLLAIISFILNTIGILILLSL